MLIDPAKFHDPFITSKGERRATVALRALETLWFNTGTLCNLTCRTCYIESSPRNDRLAYLTLADLRCYLDEVARDALPTQLIGFTGGEPFINPGFAVMLRETLARGFDVLVLTNAMQPMRKQRDQLLALRDAYGERLRLRVSLDHHTLAGHEAERGPRSWAPTVDGLIWLVRNGFAVDVASRLLTGETEAELRAGFADLFGALDIPVDAHNLVRLTVFPQMDKASDVPEITQACWSILHKSPDSVMCSSARMVVRRSGADGPTVLACTLLPYDAGFELGDTLAAAAGAVQLNHPYCASFCVLGGAACSR
jgi:MoaA/NifB/PqqE/SkfB family radical SAM enzyme